MVLYRLICAFVLLASVAVAQDGVETPIKVVEDAAELKSTLVSAYLQHEIKEGQSLLWCGAFQLAWNQFSSLVGTEKIELSGKPTFADFLNEKLTGEKDLDEKSYMVRVGNDSGLDARVANEFKEKFPNAITAPKLIPKAGVTPEGQIAYGIYAAISKDLKFPNAFTRFTTHIDFNKTHIQGFGIGHTTPENARKELISQVTVWYKSDTDFVVELHAKDPGDRLIFARIAPEKTLLDTVRAVQKRTAEAPSAPIADGERLEIPMMNFDVTRIFHEITGRSVTTVNLPNHIGSARERMRVDLNERGASVVFEADITWVIADGEESPKTKPRLFVLDGPYLMMMTRRDAKMPYFAFWVANAELLVPAKSHKADAEKPGPRAIPPYEFQTLPKSYDGVGRNTFEVRPDGTIINKTDEKK